MRRLQNKKNPSFLYVSLSLLVGNGLSERIRVCSGSGAPLTSLCFHASQVGQGVPQWWKQRSWCPCWIPLLCSVCSHVSTHTHTHTNHTHLLTKPFLRNWVGLWIQLLSLLEPVILVHCIHWMYFLCLVAYFVTWMHFWTDATWLSAELYFGTESVCWALSCSLMTVLVIMPGSLLSCLANLTSPMPLIYTPVPLCWLLCLSMAQVGFWGAGKLGG